MEDVVSIIIPNYNSEQTITCTLQSIKRQTFKNYECVIIDDNSTDNSVEIIEKIIKHDKRFKLIKSKISNGVAKTRNIGLSNSKGRYLTFLDSDDIWDKNFITKNLELRKHKNIPISHSPYIRFKEVNSQKIKGFQVNPPRIVNAKNILLKNYLPLLAIFIDRKIVGDIKFKDTRPEDYDLWIDLIKYNNYHSLSTSNVLCYYRISENQRSKNKVQAFMRIYSFYNRKLNFNKINTLFYSLRWLCINILQRFTIHRDIKSFNISSELYELLKK